MKRTAICTSALLSLSLWVEGIAYAANFDWPQWRGPDRTGLSKETGLLKSWPEGGPKRVWLFPGAGHGYSAPAIVNGKLYTLGTRGGGDILLVLDARTGQELWTAPIAPAYGHERGNGPRGTPTVDGDRVYVLSGGGTLACIRITDQKVVWQVTMQSLGGRTPEWGYAESVLIDGDKLICTPGGRQGTIAALHKLSGRVLWQSRGFRDPAQYASPIVAEINGTRQYIQLTMERVAGVSAEDGTLLWDSDWPGRAAVVPTPIHRDGLVYISSGYGVGCKLVRVGANNRATTIYDNKVMKNHHGGVVLVGDYLYGYSDAVGWVCQNFMTGAEIWSERRRLGKGALTYADGMLYCLDESRGTVALVEASPAGWNERGRFTLNPLSQLRTPRGGIWTHPVVCNGMLYLRDQELIYCYDVKGS